MRRRSFIFALGLPVPSKPVLGPVVSSYDPCAGIFTITNGDAEYHAAVCNFPVDSSFRQGLELNWIQVDPKTGGLQAFKYGNRTVRAASLG